MLTGIIISQKYWAIFRSTKEMKMEITNIIGIEIRFFINPFMNKGFTFLSINLYSFVAYRQMTASSELVNTTTIQ